MMGTPNSWPGEVHLSQKPVISLGTVGTAGACPDREKGEAGKTIQSTFQSASAELPVNSRAIVTP
jgi:hypothetical protein